jgi:exopolyphosphatase / guanosine-5'-triphosphate,3'-diphosphate pyrophosphatase
MSIGGRVAVVDVGSNSVRLLVSDVVDEHPTFVHTDKVMARIGQSLGQDGRIDDRKIGEVAGIVARFVSDARRLGAREVRAIATSATREASNGAELAEHVLESSGVALEVIDGDEEARLAFVGTLASLDEPQAGEIGVVDVGGGSTEIVVGSAADGVGWARSFRVGSGRLSDRFIAHDPPLASELAQIRAAIDSALPPGDAVPTPEYGIAVAGSATNLKRMVGPLLDEESLERALRLLSERPSEMIARQFQLETTRARLLPAGALIIEAAMQRLGTPLWVGRGGIRQGVVLDMVAAMHS